jgi:hypothetical protein
MADASEYNGGTVEADHLCVLVHGVSFCHINPTYVMPPQLLATSATLFAF